MRFIRMLVGLLILLCLVPPLVLVAAALIGRWTGCEVDPDAPHACRLLGGDYGDYLYSLVRFGDNAGAAIARARGAAGELGAHRNCRVRGPEPAQEARASDASQLPEPRARIVRVLVRPILNQALKLAVDVGGKHDL